MKRQRQQQQQQGEGPSGRTRSSSSSSSTSLQRLLFDPECPQPLIILTGAGELLRGGKRAHPGAPRVAYCLFMPFSVPWGPLGPPLLAPAPPYNSFRRASYTAFPPP